MLRDDPDTTVYEWHHTDGTKSRLRDWLYEVRFPPLYFSSLIHGGGVFRWRGNQIVLARTLAARGQYYFGTEDRSAAVAIEGHLDAFVPLPVLERYFGRLLSMLHEAGIETIFVAMPLNEPTAQAVKPELREGFAAFLRRYPGLRLAGDPLVTWPNRFFGDEYCHLNPMGAERFSRELAGRLEAMLPDTRSRWAAGAPAGPPGTAP